MINIDPPTQWDRNLLGPVPVRPSRKLVKIQYLRPKNEKLFLGRTATNRSRAPCSSHNSIFMMFLIFFTRQKLIW